MPLTPPGMTAALTTGLVSGAMLGTSVPQLALGLANGACTWAQSATVASVDTGSLGVGVGETPLIVPQPLLLAAILTGMEGAGMAGTMSPLMAFGLANGFSLGFAQGLIITTHPGVGTGSGVGKIIAGPALADIQVGLAGVGMTGKGAIQLATAISIAFGIVFPSLILPIVITGSASPTAGAGAGVGKIL